MRNAPEKYGEDLCSLQLNKVILGVQNSEES